ncbi:21404_t:CDS:2 [Racocetra persica]|uniref:21404_t:CDS:1 n=1 Tax=Racocetra persica TaxID=160502 RepID=A0ACA9MJK2_9GLOM|nr:21404_t:CDS:2 [Racocetra persica]
MSSSNDTDDEFTSSFSSETTNNKQQKCSKALLDVQLLYFKQLASENENQKQVIKKQKIDSINKDNIFKYVESQELTSKRQKQLENRMCHAFACAEISFNIAANKIFCARIQDLKPGFKIPSSKTFARKILNKQIIQVESKIENELQTKDHIILANSALENEIRINNIVGGGIKRYVATRYSFKREQYKKIAKCTSTLWKTSGNSKESCRQLLGQLASYKEGDPPFNDPFEPDCQTPQTW